MRLDREFMSRNNLVIAEIWKNWRMATFVERNCSKCRKSFRKMSKSKRNRSSYHRKTPSQSLSSTRLKINYKTKFISTSFQIMFARFWSCHWTWKIMKYFHWKCGRAYDVFLLFLFFYCCRKQFRYIDDEPLLSST